LILKLPSGSRSTKSVAIATGHGSNKTSVCITWLQFFGPTNLHAVNGGVAQVKLPSNIKAGQYLIRHEIIALHLATTVCQK
jgi:hypothetical protein